MKLWINQVCGVQESMTNKYTSQILKLIRQVGQKSFIVHIINSYKRFDELINNTE